MRITKGGSALDAAFRGLYSAFSWPLLSCQFSSRHGEERAAYIIYSPAFDPPRMHARHPSQCGVDFVVITGGWAMSASNPQRDASRKGSADAYRRARI